MMQLVHRKVAQNLSTLQAAVKLKSSNMRCSLQATQTVCLNLGFRDRFHFQVLQSEVKLVGSHNVPSTNVCW